MLILHISSSWVKIRLYTENQLPSLPGSALKVQVKLQLMLRLSWAVTILNVAVCLLLYISDTHKEIKMQKVIE